MNLAKRKYDVLVKTQRLLSELLSRSDQETTASIVTKLDELISEVQQFDSRIAHYLKRRSYHKAFACLREIESNS